MKRLRDELKSVEGVIAALALLAFVAGSVVWFLRSVTTDKPDLDAAEVFVGFGYMAGVLLVALLAIVGWRLARLVGVTERPGRQRRQRPADDHSIIRSQLAWGCILVIAGGLIGTICVCFMDAADGAGLALATAVISAGAVLLPAGAASSASGRIAQQLQDSSLPVVLVNSATRDDETTATLEGTVSPVRNDVDAYFQFQGVSEDPTAEQAPVARVEPVERIAASIPLQRVRRQLTTLETGKSYRARLVAKKADGQTVESEWVTIKSDLPTGGPAREPEPGARQDAPDE